VSSSLNTRTFLARYSLTKDALSSSTETELSAITTGTSPQSNNDQGDNDGSADSAIQLLSHLFVVAAFFGFKNFKLTPTIGSKN
jgi:hypothetical protein